MRRWLPRIGIALLVLFLLIQLVPYGRNHTNPPVIQEPNWDSTQTRDLAARACFDCHSNETKWLWYHNIAPISWGVQHDVDEGREYLNFSEWNREQEELDEIPEVIREGEMPLKQYLLAHPEARLSDAEREQLIQGLVATLNLSGEGGGDEGGERENERKDDDDK